jgi:hypothetical protein
MMDEMQNMQDHQQGGRVSKAAIRQAQRVMKSNLDQTVAYQEFKPAKVTLAYGGNGALVYFDLFPRKITLNELNAAYPGMVDKLLQHEGIGFVIAYEDDFTPVAFGKKGARNLRTGVVVGEDPLEPFGEVEMRSWQLARMADFDNSGDLILNSTLYSDGTVAALEELIGNHGGLGGEQNDAYLFHPGDMVVPRMRGSFEFKALLDSRRGLPGPTPKPPRPEQLQVNPWAFSTLGKGLGQVGTWLENARRAMALHPEAYQRIAKDAYMTAPALLIAFLAQVLKSFNSQEGFDLTATLIGYVWWFVALVILQITAQILRGKAKFTQTLRVAGFAQSAHILEILGFFPVIAPVARFIAILLAFFGVWIGTATAHQLKGWRTLVLPVVFLAVLIVGIVFLMSVVRGTAFALNEILIQLGLTAGS